MARHPLAHLAALAREVGESIRARRAAAARREGRPGAPRAERTTLDSEDVRRRLDATRERLKRQVPPPD